MRVCVLGLGHVGYPLARLLAAADHEVIGVDVDARLVTSLRQGSPHPHYAGSAAAFPAERGSLRVTAKPGHADVFVIAVPTSLRPQRGAPVPPPDLDAVDQALRGIVPLLRAGNLVLLVSTVPPGTTAGLRRALEASGLRCGTDVFLAYSPERLLPGPNVVEEMMTTPRVVGGCDPRSTDLAVRFFASFLPVPAEATDAVGAEFVKLIENTYRDVNIALANELAVIAESLGVNVREAIAIANRHPRVRIAAPGPGVGGSCVPVAPYFLLQHAPETSRLIRAAREVNTDVPRHVAAQVLGMLGKSEGRRVAALGVSYKADIGDARMSPAVEVVKQLVANGIEAAVHDPHVPGYNTPLARILHQADLLLLLVDHSAYRRLLSPSLASRQMRSKRIYDARGFFGPEWQRCGFEIARLGGPQTCGWATAGAPGSS